MPLIKPRKGEDKKTFIDRCMGDDTMNKEFPDVKQRRAVCEKQWDKGHAEAKLHYPHVISYVMKTPWAILPEKMAVIIDLLSAYAAGEKLTAEAIKVRVGHVEEPEQRQVGKIAVLPLFGVLSHRMDMMTEHSGGTSVERFTKEFRAAVEDPDVAAIVLDVNSAGGSIYGVDELSAEIYAARERKPIVAVANNLAASAAYWLASSADETVVIPSGDVGSIGVFAVHEDMSKALEQRGVKVSLVSAGKYKVEGNPYEALTDEAREALQERVNECYDAFVNAVARNRGVSPDAVREGFGQGRLVSAKKALAAGMVDYVETMDETLARLQSRLTEEGNDVNWEDITVEALRENRADLVEALTSDVVGQLEALSTKVADLEGELEEARKPLEGLSDVDVRLADAQFELQVAQAALTGISKHIYDALCAQVTTPEQLADVLPRLRQEAIAKYLQVGASDGGRATGRAHPGDYQEGDDRPEDEGGGLTAEQQEILRLAR